MMGASVRKLVVLAIAGAFLFISSAGSVLAAGKWCLVQDAKGKCRIIECKDKTPKTIAGPFDKKELAEKAKEEKCPKKDSKPAVKKDPGKKDTEPLKFPAKPTN